jgi:ArsR family transcriptional regulator
MEKYSRFFKALSDKTRLRIINLLLRSGQELCVCEIVDSINESQYNVSKHLKELKYAGLIEEKKMGRWVSYGLASARDEFKEFFFRAIASISDDLIDKDMEMLKARLLLRKEGRCIVGLQSKQWEVVLDELKKERRT